MVILSPVLRLQRWLTSFISGAPCLCLTLLSLLNTPMLSGAFRFVLPELSSHLVLHDLLRSFRLERPLSSSRVPPWDLLSVLRFLRGAPFESLSSCSLRDLTRMVLFLVSLATARRMGELQAVSSAGVYVWGGHVSLLPSEVPREDRVFLQSSNSVLLRSLLAGLCWRSSRGTPVVSGACSAYLSFSYFPSFSTSSFPVCFSSRSFSSSF